MRFSFSILLLAATALTRAPAYAQEPLVENSAVMRAPIVAAENSEPAPSETPTSVLPLPRNDSGKPMRALNKDLWKKSDSAVATNGRPVPPAKDEKKPVVQASEVINVPRAQEKPVPVKKAADTSIAVPVAPVVVEPTKPTPAVLTAGVPYPNVVNRSDDDLVLLQLRIGRSVLTESMTGYVNKGSLMLPLGQLSEVLQFAITVVPSHGRAEGWAMALENSFSLDVASRSITIAGSKDSFDPSLVEVHPDDIYVDTTLLAKWFGIDFNFSFNSQSVTLVPRQGVKLPAQALAERQQAREELSRRGAPVNSDELPKVDVPYHFATAPYADVTLEAGYDRRNYRGDYANGTLLANGDLLYMHSRVYAQLNNEDKFNELRWTLSRRDPDGQLFQKGEKFDDTGLSRAFNALKVKEFAVGDVNTQQLPLTAFSQQGRGILISSIPYDRATQYDRTTLRGDVQPGWDIELYRNDELLFYQRAGADGRYEFVDVPLLSGLNIVRLVFYGPFGQQREEVKRFMVTPDLTKQGSSQFRASLTEQDKDLFDVLTENELPSTRAGLTPLEIQQAKGKPRAMFEYEYGLTNNISAFANTAALTTGDNVDRTYISGGAATSIDGTYLRADVAHDAKNGGTGYEFQAQDNIQGVSLSADHQEYRGLVSDFSESFDDPVTRRTTLRADRAFSIYDLPRINNSLTGTHTEYDSGREIDRATYRIASAIRRLAITHNLTYLTDTTPGISSTIPGLPGFASQHNRQTLGDALLSYPTGNWILRAAAFYGITPEKELQTALTAAEYNFTRDTTGIIGVDRQFIDDRLTTGRAALSHTFDKVRLSGAVSHDSDGESTVGMTLSFSMGQNPRTKDYEFFPDYSANGGLISARAYHDVNDNGRFDGTDEVVENAQFMMDNGRIGDATKADGTVLLRNIQPDGVNSLTLDNKSIENPYLVSRTPGVRLTSRPGVPAMIDFPITGSGDVEGTVSILGNDGKMKPAANVIVQLVSANGNVLRETPTGFDGYYLMDAIPSGSYKIRISPEQEQRLGFVAESDRALVISNKEDGSHVLDLTILRN